MKTILVDDMLLDLQLFELKCADMPDFEIVGKFTDPNAAIEYAAGHVVDFALLDIDMPGMDGIHLPRPCGGCGATSSSSSPQPTRSLRWRR